MSNTRRETFKAKLAERRALLMPGAANALTARIIADLEFEAIYLSGAGVTNTLLGLPDLGFISLSELAQHTAAIRDVVDLPLMVDADTGFGNALNVGHAVRVLERAGADAIQLEDQIMPKRCGHFSGKAVVPIGEMVGKINAAVDARHDENCLIVARTDARAIEGFDAAIDRAGHYIAAGADLMFVEAPENEAEIAALADRIDAPQMLNLVIGGRTPIVDQERLASLGFAVVLYANTALQAAVYGMQAALGDLKRLGRADEGSPGVVSFAERQRLVGKPAFDALDARYGAR